MMKRVSSNPIEYSFINLQLDIYKKLIWKFIPITTYVAIKSTCKYLKLVLTEEPILRCAYAYFSNVKPPSSNITEAMWIKGGIIDKNIPINLKNGLGIQRSFAPLMCGPIIKQFRWDNKSVIISSAPPAAILWNNGFFEKIIGLYPHLEINNHETENQKLLIDNIDFQHGKIYFGTNNICTCLDLETEKFTPLVPKDALDNLLKNKWSNSVVKFAIHKNQCLIRYITYNPISQTTAPNLAVYDLVTQKILSNGELKDGEELTPFDGPYKSISPADSISVEDDGKRGKYLVLDDRLFLLTQFHSLEIIDLVKNTSQLQTFNNDFPTALTMVNGDICLGFNSGCIYTYDPNSLKFAEKENYKNCWRWISPVDEIIQIGSDNIIALHNDGAAEIGDQAESERYRLPLNYQLELPNLKTTKSGIFDDGCIYFTHTGSSTVVVIDLTKNQRDYLKYVKQLYKIGRHELFAEAFELLIKMPSNIIEAIEGKLGGLEDGKYLKAGKKIGRSPLWVTPGEKIVETIDLYLKETQDLNSSLI